MVGLTRPLKFFNACIIPARLAKKRSSEYTRISFVLWKSRQPSELGLGKVGSWYGEDYLAAFDGDVRVALHSFAGHLEVERDSCVPNWVKCG